MDENERTLLQLFFRVVHEFFNYNYKQLSKMHVHPGQVMLLTLLLKRGGISQREIGEILCVKPSTVAVSIKRMEKSGLVYRENDRNDKRVWRVYLTDAGKALGDKFKKTHQGNEKVLFGNFTTEDKAQLKVYLEKIYNNIINDSQNPKCESVIKKRKGCQ